MSPFEKAFWLIQLNNVNVFIIAYLLNTHAAIYL